MPRLLRACALVLLASAAACGGSSEPVVGSPGLEPPHDRQDGGAGPSRNPDEPEVSDAGSGGMPDELPGGGALGGAGGATQPMNPVDAGAEEDAGSVPFSELHLAELTKDCRESVQCFLQRGAQLEPDPLDGCLANSRAVLDANPKQQARFLAIFARCGALMVCDYYDCVSSQP